MPLAVAKRLANKTMPEVQANGGERVVGTITINGKSHRGRFRGAPLNTAIPDDVSVEVAFVDDASADAVVEVMVADTFADDAVVVSVEVAFVDDASAGAVVEVMVVDTFANDAVVEVVGAVVEVVGAVIVTGTHASEADPNVVRIATRPVDTFTSHKLRTTSAQPDGPKTSITISTCPSVLPASTRTAGSAPRM